MSTTAAPALVTHIEIGQALGSDRTRQRWENDGLLPRPRWIHGFGRSLGLYPGVILARLVAGRRAGAAETALSNLTAQCAVLIDSKLFDETAIAVGEELARLPVALTPALMECLDQRNLWGRLIEASNVIANADDVFGISFSRENATVVRAYEGALELLRGRDRVRVEASAVLGAANVGDPVVVESVKVGGTARDYVLPTIPVAEPVLLTGLDEADWDAMFAGITSRPVSLNVVRESSDEGGDVMRPRPRFGIRVDSELIAGANPTARS